MKICKVKIDNSKPNKQTEKKNNTSGDPITKIWKDALVTDYKDDLSGLKKQPWSNLNKNNFM